MEADLELVCAFSTCAIRSTGLISNLLDILAAF